MPYSMDVNDGWNFRLNIEADEFDRAVIDQFDRLYDEGAKTGRMLSFALHPYVMGQPHRIAHLEKLLDYMLSKRGVWQAYGVEIADWYTQNYLPVYQQHLASMSAR